MNDRLNALNTTNFRIVVSVVCTAAGMGLVLVAVLFFRWEPTPAQMTVLEGMVIVALTMMGFDVLQFIGKRFSDSSYAAAKTGPPPQVNVAAPSTVQVTPADATGTLVKDD